MHILILGGTVFLGRHVVEASLARGHDVTLFNRGQTRPELFPELEKLHGDRDGDLGALVGRSFDAVVDTSGAAAPARRVSLPEATPSNRRSACLLGDLQPSRISFAIEVSGSFEAVSLVERDRAALALPGARPHRADAPVPEVLDDQVERCCTEASSW
jgi:putative NADH-flavin reductase